jgi:hypothetical protein
MLPRREFLNLILMLANYLSFYLIWIGCLFAAVRGWSFFSACAVLLYLILHLYYVSVSPKAEGVLIAAIVGIGILNDIVLTSLGVISYVDAAPIGTSWWMIALWACFGSTYWHAFSWLDGRLLLAAILGAIAVPFCYLWGIKAGAVCLLMGETKAFCIVALMWFFLLPFSFVVSHCIKKFILVKKQ